MAWFSKKQDGSSGLGTELQVEKLKSDILINAISDGVLIVDQQGAIQIFNTAATKLTGWLADEAIGIDYRSVIVIKDEKGEAYPEAEHPIAKVFASGKPVNDGGGSLATKSGSSISVDISVSPFLKDETVVIGAIVIIRDISEKREDEKRRADFISTASHEMRTPVAAIEGYLALALNEHVSKIDAKARSFLEKAHASTQHLGKLFQDLLTSAKAEDGRLTNHPTVVELGEFTEKLSEDLKFAAVKKGLQMEFVVGTGPNASTMDARTAAGNKVVRPLYYAHVDPDRLREVITNLFDNAVKYTEAGKVTLGITGNNDVVQLHIADTGPGIPAADIPHLFQKFYRVDNSATRTIGGTGLGLFICRKIIELYHGRIWAESTVGKGSTFYINIPRLSTERANQLKASEANQSTVRLPQPASTNI